MTSFLRLASRLDPYFLAMVAVVVLAFAWPSIGAKQGPLHLGLVVQLGVSLIFFLHGAALDLASIRQGIANWRLHLFVQTSTFVLFPLIGAAIFALPDRALHFDLRLGFFYLCAVCSTVSSSVAMVAMARGNLSSAIFNATLSGIAGMILTPALVAMVYATKGTASVSGMVLEVMRTLLLPFVAGQIARPLLREMVARYKKGVSRLDRGVILLIVYVSFCDSVESGVWARTSAKDLLAVSLLALALLGAVLTITTLGARALGFAKEDEIVALFCGSKKSLANGVPIAGVLFGGSPATAMILLPLMLYHQAQLIVGAILAKRYARRGAG